MDSNVYIGAAVVIIAILAIVFLLPSTTPTQQGNYTQNASAQNTATQNSTSNVTIIQKNATNTTMNNTNPTPNPYAANVASGGYIGNNTFKFYVTLNNNSITPAVINVTSGFNVILNVYNNAPENSSFTINNPNGTGYLANTGMMPSTAYTFNSFVAPAPGNYTFYNLAPGAEAAGAKGTLVVR